VESSRVNGMPKKKRKTKVKTVWNDFDLFKLTVKRLFPKHKISLKLLKTIWRNKQLRALFIRLLIARALVPRKPSKSRKTKKRKTPKSRKKAKATKRKTKKSKRKKKSKSKTGRKKVSFIAKSGPNKGKRITFFVKRLV